MSFGKQARPYDFSTHTLTAQNTGTASFSVPGLKLRDVVVLTSQTAQDGGVVVDSIATGVLTIRNVASEAADLTLNVLVLHND